MSKLCFIDIETTGLDEKVNGIWQIAFIVANKVGNTLDPVFKFSTNCNILPDDTIDEDTVLKGLVKPGDLPNFQKPSEAKEELIKQWSKFVNRYDKLDKFIFCGYNAGFDFRFMLKWFKKMNDKYFFSWFFAPPLDIMSLALDELQEYRSGMEKFRLPHAAKALGIKVEEGGLHDALYDIQLTYEIYRRILQRREDRRVPSQNGTQLTEEREWDENKVPYEQ
jgi:DNA polymerase-3 subunit epsilon